MLLGMYSNITEKFMIIAKSFSAIYSAVYAAILSFLTIQYIYRVCVLRCPQLVQYFRGWRFILWLGYVFMFGLAWGVITYFYAYPDEYARDYVR